MIFQDTITVDAPAAKVWDFLLDINRSSGLVPGVQQITLVDERTFDGVIEARVGPISGNFQFRAHIVDSKPPTELKAEVEGNDSVTRSTLRMDIDMSLDPLTPETTSMSYKAVVDVRGRLAILGDMVLRATAALILEDFAKRLRSELASEEGAMDAGSV